MSVSIESRLLDLRLNARFNAQFAAHQLDTERNLQEFEKRVEAIVARNAEAAVAPRQQQKQEEKKPSLIHSVSTPTRRLLTGPVTITEHYRATDKILDYYLEIGFVGRIANQYYARERWESKAKPDEDPNAEGYLMRTTYRRYRDCLQVDKSKCPIRNARFHYVDVREEGEDILRQFYRLHVYLEVLVRYWSVDAREVDPDDPASAFALMMKQDDLINKIERTI
jgi:hypothetical protein